MEGLVGAICSTSGVIRLCGNNLLAAIVISFLRSLIKPFKFNLSLSLSLSQFMTLTLLWSEITIFSRTVPDPNAASKESASGTDLSIWSILIHAPGLYDWARQVTD